MANGNPGRQSKYTPELKRRAVNYYLANDGTQCEIAEDVSIPRKLFSNRVR